MIWQPFMERALELAREARTGDDDGVKLTILTAGVNVCGQVLKKRVIEVATDKRAIELFQVHAGEDGAETGVDHLVRGGLCGPSPQRKQRCEASTRKVRLSIGAHVFEKEVSKSDRFNSTFLRFRDRPAHGRLILLVATRIGERYGQERQSSGSRLGFEHRGPHGMHGDTVDGAIQCGEKTNHLDSWILSECPQRIGAVFAAARPTSVLTGPFGITPRLSPQMPHL